MFKYLHYVQYKKIHEHIKKAYEYKKKFTILKVRYGKMFFSEKYVQYVYENVFYQKIDSSWRGSYSSGRSTSSSTISSSISFMMSLRSGSACNSSMILCMVS